MPHTVDTTAPSSIVALRSLHGRPCAKVIRPGGNPGSYQITPYGRETQWWPEVYPAGSFVEMARSLGAMMARNDVIVVHGALPTDIALLPNIGVMRRLNGGPSSGGLFMPAPRQWMAIDVDGACPAPDAQSDEEALRILRSALPERFNDVMCFYQFTSSHLLAGSATTLRVRLWFYLDAPVDPARWKVLFAPIRSDLCIDTAIYNPVQPVFVCTPTFADGADDPVLVRCGVLAGAKEAVVTAGLPDAPLASPDEVILAGEGDGNEDQIEQSIARILGQRTTGARHLHLLGAACELVGLGCPPGKMLPTLNELIRAQGREPQVREALNAIQWARKKLANGQLHTDHKPVSAVFPDDLPAADQKPTAAPAPTPTPETPPATDPLAPTLPPVDDNFDYGGHSWLNTVRWLNIHYPKGGLVRWQEDDYEWNGHRYVLMGAEWLKAKIQNTSCLKTKQVNEMTQAIRSRVYHGAETAPFWIDDPWKSAHQYLTFTNGVLDLDEWMLEPNLPLQPHDANLFTLCSTPYPYDPDARCPGFDAWLAATFKDDNDTRREYLKMLGYCLLSDNRMQKLFVLQGPPRSGKGLTLGIIERLVGETNIGATDFGQLDTQFGLWPLIGKRIALIGEVEENKRISDRVIGRIKSISGNDPVPIDRKGSSIVMQRMACRFVLTCNRLPGFLDPTGALASRSVMFRFTESYVGREDWDLPRKLANEQSGILNRALEGLRQLMFDGRFTPSRASQKLLDEFREVMDPTGAFFVECTEKGSDDFVVSATDLYRAYKAWATDSELHVRSKQAINNHLRQVLQIDQFRPRMNPDGTSNHVRLKYWQGIRLNAEGVEWLRRAGPEPTAFNPEPAQDGT